MSAIKAYGVDECYNWKPLLNGKEVIELTGMKQGGPDLGVLMEACFNYQLVRPNAKKEECTEWLLKNSSIILSGGGGDANLLKYN